MSMDDRIELVRNGLSDDREAAWEDFRRRFNPSAEGWFERGQESRRGGGPERPPLAEGADGFQDEAWRMGWKAADAQLKNEIVTEMFDAAGLSGRDVPAISDDGRLTDGVISEPAAQDEVGLREQCRRWIEAVGVPPRPFPSAPADGSMWCGGCGALLWAESTGRQPQPAAWHDSAPWCASCEDAPQEQEQR